MSQRQRSLALILVGVAIVLSLGLILPITTGASEANPGGFQVQISASEEGNLVTYSITLVNDGSTDIGDIYVAGSVPAGAKFEKATATPAESWYRGFEGTGDNQAAVWLSTKVAKNSKQGPFSYQVSLKDGSAAANAWVRWKTPTEGSAIGVAAIKVLVAGTNEYAGSEACFKCHAAQYNDFRVSGHPYKLRPASEAKYDQLPLPAGYTWEDISYVIGGANWKSRYLDKQGYIITAADGKPGKNQYNIATGKWSDYEAGKVKKYDCGSCHTTGYSTSGNQDGLPGIVGSWALPGIQCEACHGPGRAHIDKGGDKASIRIDRSSAFCGTCHIRDAADTIPAGGGFIQHHEQYNEMLAGPHKDLNCVTCHNPHKAAEFSIKTDCASCHSAAKQAFTGSSMEKRGVQCADCHLSQATKSAVADGPNKGDVKTHIFAISTDPDAKMFTDDGKFAKGFVTLNFACLGCHSDQNVQWAASYAKNAHTLGK